MDPLLTQMNAERDRQVEKENERTVRIFERFLRDEIQPYLDNLHVIDEQIRASAKESFNTIQASASLKLSLERILNPSIQDYKLYWQPDYIVVPQAQEMTISTSKRSETTHTFLKQFLLSSILPSLEEFRQVLRARYPEAIISSQFVYQEEPYILITIVYALKRQEGIRIITHPVGTIHGGVLWSNPEVVSSLP